MKNSFSEFKFYQSYRIPLVKSDGLLCRFRSTQDGKERIIEDARLVDISVSGLGFKSTERFSNNEEILIHLKFKKYDIELEGRVVRSFSDALSDEEIVYGVEIESDRETEKLIESIINSFSQERLRDCLIQSALKESYSATDDGLEMFSLLLTVFKDLTKYGEKEDFVQNILSEVVRVLNAQRATVFLINADTNELEAKVAMGTKKEKLKFDYRLGIAGSVFTTGVALNINTQKDSSRFNNAIDSETGFETKSIICYPLHNREDKVIGVVEVLNKRNDDRFSVEDEKIMKVISLVFSSVYHAYSPISDKSQIRRFSNPFDRQNAMIGKNHSVNQLRTSIIRLKDLEAPVLITGEKGSGKFLYASILHQEGNRGLKSIELVDCAVQVEEVLERKLITSGQENVFEKCGGGVVVLREIGHLSFKNQERLWEIIKSKGVVGSKFSIDVRLMATTSDDLALKVENGEFNRELYDYVSQCYIHIDPLRRRREDIPTLIDYFLKTECKKHGLLLKSFSAKAMDKLLDHDWPCNISELKKCVERAVLYNPKGHIITDNELENTAAPLLDIESKARIFGNIPHIDNHHIPLKERMALIEKEVIESEIRRANGNKSLAAKNMGISREALRKKLLTSDEILDGLDQEEAKKAA